MLVCKLTAPPVVQTGGTDQEGLALIVLLAWTVEQRLHGQLDATFFVRLHDLDADNLAFLEVVRDFLHGLEQCV